jgi:hypothetical protein
MENLAFCIKNLVCCLLFSMVCIASTQGNTFNSCLLSIQGDALQTLITGNNIYGLPGETEMSAGIFMRDSDYTIGGILNGTDYAGNFISRVYIGIAALGGTTTPVLPVAPEIKNNTISQTRVAVYAINDNANLDIACNTLLNYNHGILVRSWMGIPANLKDQGDCDNPFVQNPAFNTFALAGAYDLYADALSLPFKYSDINATNLISSDPSNTQIEKIDCDPIGSPCNNYIPPAIEGMINETTDPKTQNKILSYWLRQYQADSNEVAAMQLLQQNAALPLAAQKLVQQYYDTENYAAANNILDAIDRSYLEADQFYTLQKMLIQLKQEGKTLANINAQQEQTLLDIANSHTSVGYRAQAILYQARGYEFPVIIPPLPNEDNYGYTVFKTNTSVISAKVQTFVPNPATQTAYLTYELPNDSNATLVITDINGKIQQQATLVGAGTYSLDTRYLSSGLYLYSVEQNGKILLRSKLAIIK